MTSGEWRCDRVDGIIIVRCSALATIPGIAHAFSTRLGPDGAGFDLGPAGPAAGVFQERRAAFLRAAGLGGSLANLPRQVHGVEIVDVRAIVDGTEADGVIASFEHGLARYAPAIRTADCVPLLLADRCGRAVVAVHGGWRGTAAGIAQAAVRAVASRGVAACDLVVAMGPSIRSCCYEVGDEVIAALAESSRESLHLGRGPSGRSTVDLSSVHRSQLVAVGVGAGDIHDAPWCTRCRNDLFFSARAEGDRAGRMMAVIGSAAA